METGYDAQAETVPAAGMPNGIGDGDLGNGNSAAPTTSGAVLPEGVDLTQLPQFRQYQSQMDRARTEAEQRAAQLQARLEAMEAAQLEALSPEEQLAHIRKQQEEDRRKDKEDQRVAAISRQAQDACTEFGIQWTDPAVQSVLSRIPPTEQGLAQFNLELARMVKRRAASMQQQTEQQVDEATNRARVNALNTAGVTRTSTTAPTTKPSSREEQQWKRWKKTYAELIGKGTNNPAVFELAAEMRAQGFTFDDLRNH
jgi:hypothetical protein